MAAPGTFPFVKGHGTENDFVLLPDPNGRRHTDLDGKLVTALCDRRAGIGADGVLRVVRCAAYDDPASVAARGSAEWFMDYRNADGSLAQMCGNGLRVFGRYLVEHEGADRGRPLPIGTRAGIRTVGFEEDGLVSVDMGRPSVFAQTTVCLGDRSLSATHVDMGNPHAVVFVDDLDGVGTLRPSPSYDQTTFPDGVNVEFVVRRGARHLAMRVHERGSGETRSCGTGACAVAVAAAVADHARRDGADLTYRVDVAGGELAVTWTADGRMLLTGPALLVASGRVWLTALEVGKSFATADPAVRVSPKAGNTAPALEVAPGGHDELLCLRTRSDPVNR